MLRETLLGLHQHSLEREPSRRNSENEFAVLLHIEYLIVYRFCSITIIESVLRAMLVRIYQLILSATVLPHNIIDYLTHSMVNPFLYQIVTEGMSPLPQQARLYTQRKKGKDKRSH